MSGMVECYLINNEGLQCDFSPAVTNTRVIFGKNQPFLCVEIEVSKYMFDSNDFWAERPHPEGTDPLARPNLIQNTTPVHIKTYGGEYDLIYTQTLNPNESTYVFLCYTKMWQSKTTEVSSLISDIVWSGQDETYDSGVLSVTCNGLTSLVQIAGAFQPTAKAGSIHKNVQIIKPSKLNTLNVPTMTKTNIGSLRVLVPIYVDPDIPSDALVGYTEPTQDISFDDIQGTMRADTVYASILFDYSAPFSKQDLNNYYKGAFSNWVIPDIDAYIYHASTKVQQNVEGVMVESSSAQLDGILYCQGVEYVTGYGQTLFAWLSKVIGGYDGDELVIDKGYQMERSENILSQLNYTTEDLADYKAGTESRTYGDSIYKILPDTVCYDLIKAVSVASNRHAYFADAPYLSSFEVSDFKPNSLSDLKIQYTPNDGSYAAYFIPYGETEPQQIILGSGVEYNDQGSTYLVGEQTAKSANASVTVKATDAGTDIAGMPVEVSIDTESIEGSKEILAQVAFNTLVENYHPSNTLSFIALENSSTPATTNYIAYMTREPGLPQASDLNEGKYYVKTGYNDVGLYLSTGTDWTRIQPITGNTVTVYAPSNIYYFSFNGTSWDEYSYVSIVERHALFRPDTRCASLEDTRSHTTLTNVSLAYTVLSWPDCTTKYMFGDPIFQDTEETIAELQSIAKQSITNTSVSEALNKPYVTAAIGNIPLDQAGDDLTDFSGLILQKNDSTGVASMDGYMGGQRQARFSSDGAISSGVVTYHSPRSSDPTALTEAGDSVVMDRDGFHTRSWHLYPQTSPQFAYSDGYWVEETRIGVDGEISAGAGSVVLGHDGLTNYDSDGEPAYTLDDDGLKYKGQPIINSENGKIQLKVDGAAIDGNLRAISITLPYVQIDDKGMRTFNRYYWDTDAENYVYDPHDLQCAVGTNGIIIAGAGAVKLDANGLTTYSGAINPVATADDTGLIDYSNAIPQCKVTTSGQFIAGNASNGWSVLDNTGLKLYTKGADPTAIGVNRNPIVWIDTDGYHMDNSRAYTSSTSQIEKATFNYGTWANYVDKDGDIKANVNLLSNARLNAGPVCRTVDNDGNTTAEYYSVCLHPNGLSTYSYEASGGIVDGIASGTVTTTEQCRIDNTGKIVAGANLVTLCDTGILVGTPGTANSPPSLISMGASSSFEILNNSSSTPAVTLSQGASRFNNPADFSNDVVVSGGAIKLGNEGSQIATGSISVSVSPSSGGTAVTSTSPIVNTVAANGTILAGRSDATLANYVSTFDAMYDITQNPPTQITRPTPTTTRIVTPTGKESLITVEYLSYIDDTLYKNYAGHHTTFTYETAKSPEKWPEFSLYLWNYPISDLLRTCPYIPTGQTEYQISGHTEFIFQMNFGANTATDATLAEIVEVTLTYREYTYDSSRINPSAYSKVGTLTQTQTIYATDSGLKQFVFKLPQRFYKENGVITGTYVGDLVSVSVLIKLPLSRTVTFNSFLGGTLAASGDGAFFVSKFGAWGATPVIDPNTLTLVPNGIAPMVNQTFLAANISALYSTGLASTSASTTGVRNILLVGYSAGSQPVLPQSAREGDIVMCYKV